MAVTAATAARAAYRLRAVADKVGRALSGTKGKEGAPAEAKVACAFALSLLILPVLLVAALTTSATTSPRLPSWMTSEFVVAAYKANEDYGIPVSAGLAQMLYEAGSDVSGNRIAAAHNFAGVAYAGQAKACGKVDVGERSWAAFPSDAAWLDYYYNDLLQQGNYTSQERYKAGIERGDAHEFLAGLAAGGYCEGATGDDYADAAIAAASRYPLLAQLDSMTLAQALVALAGGGGAASASGSAIVDAAMSQLGVPYVWGGATPYVGLDCSGLTMYCLACAGISVPHYSEDQYAAATRRVPVPEAQPGDILYRPGHVAVYAGGDSYVHAPTTGDVVRVAYGIEAFQWALRF